MPLQATSGAASYDAFGGGVPFVPTYIEDVFSTWLYTGTGASQTHPNGIDLAGKGGLVWLKRRSGVESHYLQDSSSSFANSLSSNSTAAAIVNSGVITSVSSTGFTTSSVSSGTTYASWTFREQPKFFDVVTFTTGPTGETNFRVPHNLGVAPACIIVKSTGPGGWYVYNQNLNGGGTGALSSYLLLNSANAASTWADIFGTSVPTATDFGINTNIFPTSTTLVAYLFAHNAGGFGLTGTDNVISCGSFTTGSSGYTNIDLGWEPQWVLVKSSSANQNWQVFDNMRGFNATDAATLWPNQSAAESTGQLARVTATGFQMDAGWWGANRTFIYIAIRRGPMRTPTTGTSVFSPQVQTPTGSAGYVMAGSSGFPVDWLITKQQTQNNGPFTTSRLTSNVLSTSSTAAESVFAYGFDLMQGVGAPWDAQSTVSYAFRRAPGYMDVVCYTGIGDTLTLNHNLTVPPELIIVKRRNAASAIGWPVGFAFTASGYSGAWLNLTDAKTDSTYTGSNIFKGQPTATTFTVGPYNDIGGFSNYVAYLFASCPGVSKVGSYTGNGSSQTINMGFTGGARFFLVKRTDSTGDWWVYDSARGIVSAADPALRLNSTAAEVTSADAVDTDSTGLIVNQESTCNINVSSATYIYLGIS